MADTCIVCLGDLRTSLPEDPLPDSAAPVQDGGKHDVAKTIATDDAKSSLLDEETIAHLLPCKHDLHNECLKPWVERANSCPICRTIFNTVELSHGVGGPVLDSYPVQDKLQEAELDPGMIVEDELFDAETFEPCIVCGNLDDGHGAMYCDACDKPIHTFCAGYDEAPEVWHCQACLANLERNLGVEPRRQARRRNANSTRAPAPARRRRNNDRIWARVWQEVSRRLDFDLDFPYDEDTVDQRTEEQRREFERWQRRFEVAGTPGTVTRLRDIAAGRLQPARPTQPEPESQDVIRAWNAFDKARESQEALSGTRRRKRKATDSPASPLEPEVTAPQPQLKRPRLRRPHVAFDQPESSRDAAERPVIEPTYLSSLLREVENKPISASSPVGSDHANGHISPHDSSPARSPASSECGSPRPRAASTPPPQRPHSPPLSSSILPMDSPPAATFSPHSPAGLESHPEQLGATRYRSRRRPKPEAQDDNIDGSSERASSPSGLSISTKREIQRMVKVTLRERYHENSITTDQYTDINRDVSRKLYDLVKDASALADQAERAKWQDIANDEVRHAVSALSPGALSPGAETQV